MTTLANPTSNRARPERALTLVAVGVLLLISFYGFALFGFVPYPGLAFSPVPEGWLVTRFETCTGREDWCSIRDQLQVGDVLTQIGDLEYQEFRNNRRAVPFSGYQPGNTVPLVVLREGETLDVEWLMPSVLAEERVVRLGGLLLAVPFWLVGTGILVLLQPRDERRRLLVVFNYLNAIWLTLGFLSVWQFAYASLLLHIAIWMFMPVALHLHMALPSYLIPRRHWFLYLIYIISGVLIVLELLRLIPSFTFNLGFAVSILGSIALLLRRLAFPKSESERLAVRLMLAGLVLAVGPAAVLFTSSAILGTPVPQLTLNMVLLLIPLLPLFYTYALYKRRLGAFEFRANRLLGIYSFVAVVITGFVVLFILGIRLLEGLPAGFTFFYSLIATIFLLLMSVALRARFLRLVDRLAYGVKYSPEEVVQVFAQQLPGIIERPALLSLLADDLLPSMLVRQSALLRINEHGRGELLYARDIDLTEESLDAATVGYLRANALTYQPDALPAGEGDPWVRLAVPLTVGQRDTGLWLLGRRDPDDFYPQRDVQLLQALANQMASVLENIQLLEEVQRNLAVQAERRQEAELMAELTASLSGTLELEEVLQRVISAVSRFVRGTDHSAISILEPDGQSLRTHTSWAIEAHQGFLPAGTTLPLSAMPAAQQALDTAQPAIVNDPRLVHTNGHAQDVATQVAALRTVLWVPLIARGQRIGMMHLATFEQTREFRPEEISFCVNMASQAAIVIENSRLYQELQSHADRLAEQVALQTAELRAERDRTQAILHNAGESIFFADPNGIILYANPAAMRLSGHTVKEITDRPILEWLGTQVGEETRESLAAAIAGGEPWTGELEGEHRTGRTYIARVAMAPIFSEEDELAGFVGVLADITRLREVDRLRSEFIANVSHELRTPLTNIKTYLALLGRGKAESREQYMDILRLETDRLSRLIEDLLDFSRKRTAQPNFQQVDVKTLVGQTVSVFAAAAEKKNITLEAEDIEDNLLVWGDVYHLSQVLSNLVNNALAYTPAGGRITICALPTMEDGEPWVSVQVADTGMGIAAQDLPFVFERFYRGQASQQGNIPGTGLGLAISQEIMQRHGGSLEVESVEGNGSTFSVRMPLQPEGQPA